jgi:acyl-CoA thioesterase
LGSALFGEARPSIEYVGTAMPDVPGPDRCVPVVDKPVPEATAGELVEHRLAAPPLPLAGGDKAQLLVWMRLQESRPLDPLLACMLADAAPPALYGHLSEYVAMPSTDITLHFADTGAMQESRWLLGDFRTGYAGGGYAVEDGDLWTPSGRLVLQTRQLRMIRQPQLIEQGAHDASSPF